MVTFTRPKACVWSSSAADPDAVKWCIWNCEDFACALKEPK